MRPESFIELVGSGNPKAVEEAWMALLEPEDKPVDRLTAYHVVLRELAKTGQASLAQSLAWAAIESVSGRSSPEETLRTAGPFLLAAGESDELRSQAVDLYRTVFGEREGFEAILTEAGLSGGRPVRRALRTLDVCLAIDEGDYLASRDEEEDAARVESVDRSEWQFTLSLPDGTTTLGAVHLADGYMPAPRDDFRIMRQFFPEELGKHLWAEPVAVIADLCRQHGMRMDSDALRAKLVPDLLTDAEWKRWWTKARAAAKRSPNVTIEGRTPYDITFTEDPQSLEDPLLEAFGRAHGSAAKLELVEKYVRDCKSLQKNPCEETIRQCHDILTERAAALAADKALDAAAWWMSARRVAFATGLTVTDDGSVDYFRALSDPRAVIGRLEDDALLPMAFDCLQEAKPDEWEEHLLALLPSVSLAGCESAACRLADAGRSTSDFEPVVTRIVSSPIDFFEALLWLWDGPSRTDAVPVPTSVTLLTRIIRALDECRRSDTIPKETAKNIGLRARAVLSARKYEQFLRCLDQLDPGMGRALQTQIARLDNLGPAVRQDMVNKLRERFPPTDIEPETPPWKKSDVLYVTERGMVKKQQEIDHHVNVVMKENAQAIGRAAAHGDLSENSEYKFALEERDLLRARLAQMNSEVAAAKVFTPDDVPTDHVGIGSHVFLKRVDDGECYDLSFFGPWEADSEIRRFNYQTPLAEKVMGKRVGETVVFEHTGAVGTYEVVELKNGFPDES